MKAAAIDQFGGPEALHTETLPTPRLGPREVLIEVNVAGIGSWDSYLINGELGDAEAGFPRIFGSDGSGTIVACGEKVKSLKKGDRVYGWGFDSKKGGFFAEYCALQEDKVAKIPNGLSIEEAGGLAIDGIVALEGLDLLKCDPGDCIIIIGASGGAGHIACQLAKRRGLRVFAVASGPDGVELVKRLGADGVADGREGRVVALAQEVCASGYDGALVFAGAPDGWRDLLAMVKKRCVVAYPNGVEPAPSGPSGVKVKVYDGVSTPKMFAELNELIEKDVQGTPFHLELSRLYSLDEAAEAVRDSEKHHLGKLGLRLR
jgi:NADPH:quinone reductase-like Zn-dependent oxidoreductase